MRTCVIYLFAVGALFYSGCSVYNSRFQKGGGLTSDFLERIKENPRGEDTLLPPEGENCNG
ncbi:MAG: hypothetical protein AAF443_00210 [Chlamydiota bacterium]